MEYNIIGIESTDGEDFIKYVDKDGNHIDEYTLVDFEYEEDGEIKFQMKDGIYYE